MSQRAANQLKNPLRSFTMVLYFLGSYVLPAQKLLRQEANALIRKCDNFLSYAIIEDAVWACTDAINTDQNYANAYMKGARVYQRAT